MRRAQVQERSPLASVAKVSLVAILALVVLWQAGHSFVPAPPDGGESPEMTTAPKAYITTSNVNVRTGPGTSHDVLSVLPVKTRLAVIGAQQTGFAPVEVGGRQAWVSADYIAPESSVLAVQANVPDEPVEPEPTAVPTGIPEQEPEAQIAVAGTQAQLTAAETVDIPAQVVQEQTTSETIDVPETDTADVPAGERWIEIDRTLSTVTLHEGVRIVAVYDALMGKDPSPDGYYSTAVGTHYVFAMNRELTETPFAPGVYLTDFVGFDPARSNGIHSPVRDAEGNVVVTGGTTTLGCVRLGADEARAVFDFAEIGMRVEVHD